MESMPVILLFWMITFTDSDVKQIEKYNYDLIFLDDKDDDDFYWQEACRVCDSFDCDGCCDERE